MPLSQPAERERLHTRAIEINGYRRVDGHYDIEAHLTDVKSFGQSNYDRGYIEAGDPVHDMWLRLTVDEKMHIHAVEAVSDKTPYAICPAAAPNFTRLVGMRIKAGFLRDATHKVGGTVGCYASARTAPADGHHRLSDHQSCQGSARDGGRGGGGQARQRYARPTDHREVGRREQDTQYLPGVRRAGSAGETSLAPTV